MEEVGWPMYTEMARACELFEFEFGAKNAREIAEWRVQIVASMEKIRASFREILDVFYGMMHSKKTKISTSYWLPYVQGWHAWVCFYLLE